MRFLHEFSKYSNGAIVDNGWWQISDDGKCLINMSGGYHSYVPCEDDIIVEADGWECLDWSFLIKQDSIYGWIDREGTFYGCDFHDHEAVATLVLKKSEIELEKMGYIKIYRDFNGERKLYQEGIPSEAQMDTLINLGLDNLFIASVFDNLR